MKSKAAQISVFVILGIVVLGLIGVGVFFFKGDKNQISDLRTGVGMISENLQDCFENVSAEGLVFIGKQGGYSREPLTEYVNAGKYDIPFYYLGEILYSPDMALMEEELGYYFDSNKQVCYNQIDNYNIEYLPVFKKTNVSIDENSVKFLINDELIIMKDNESAKINFNAINVKSNLKDINWFAKYIAFSYGTSNQELCLNCFLDVAYDKNLLVEIDNEIDNLLFVNIYDNRTGYYPEHYRFVMSNVVGNVSLPISLVQENTNVRKSDLNVKAPVVK